jgi:acyl-CoA synthetase (AMP-forming)/AMP-acid ligase II
MRIVDGTLRIRSPGVAARYVGGRSPQPVGADGFVDTGDAVERQGERCYFAGRKEGIINVGGQKVHPEEVEAVINGHPEVELSLAYARNNPITGGVVAAKIVLKGADNDATDDGSLRGVTRRGAVLNDILRLCRTTLPPHKVPATLQVVPSLALTAAGKLARTVA